jgi:ubiquinone/menaquinone biosynthesis C-methylase UbiE
MKEEKVKKIVRKRYGNVAKNGSSCCASSDSSCGCTPVTSGDISRKIGYSEEELSSVPEGANLGLGCGNPIALASLKEGETVLDLGSGAGFDCFLAAKKVGKKGKVIGVDMTPEMLIKGRTNARKGKYTNVEFRLGEIENLPVPDKSVNVIISNCVINLSPNKRQVFEEAYRVLAPNGRLMVSDIVLLDELPKELKENAQAYTSCISGAELKEKYLNFIKEAGFKEVKVIDETNFPSDFIASDTAQELIKTLGISAEKIKEIGNNIVSIKVSAIKH